MHASNAPQRSHHNGKIIAHSDLRVLVINTAKYSTTPIIRTLAIWIANYPKRLGPSGKSVDKSTKLALKLPAIGSSREQCFGF